MPGDMNLQIVGLQTHADESPLAFTVMFDDLDRGRRMVATVSEAALRDSVAHPDCEAIDVEPMARGTVNYEKYETEAVVRVIKKFIRDKANRENPE
jgi:hypothetical protein